MGNVAEELGYCSSNPTIQAKYEELRRNGVPHGMAQVLATRRFPKIRTDSTFNEGRCNGNQFEKVPELGDHYKSIAESAGVSVTGKTYLSSLARFPGDPEAWVDGRGDVERIALKRGWTVQGDVSVKGHECDFDNDPVVADDIIERETLNFIDQNPGTRIEDAREKVIEVLSGEVDKGFDTVDQIPVGAIGPD
jgi:hypothetical protein